MEVTYGAENKRLPEENNERPLQLMQQRAEDLPNRLALKTICQEDADKHQQKRNQVQITGKVDVLDAKQLREKQMEKDAEMRQQLFEKWRRESQEMAEMTDKMLKEAAERTEKLKENEKRWKKENDETLLRIQLEV